MATGKIKEEAKRLENEDFLGYDDEFANMPHMGPAMAITVLISFLVVGALIIYGLIQLALWLK